MDKMNANSSEPLSSSLIPQENRTTPRLDQVMFEVLDNPSLREEILKNVIFGREKKVEQQTACNLRLVQKSWNDSVLGILWKVHEPLYKVIHRTGGSNSDAAIKLFNGSSDAAAMTPPLKFSGTPFHQTDIRNLSNFFTGCGQGLVHLKLRLDGLHITSPDPFPSWPLPRLHKLKISLAMLIAAGGVVGGVVARPDTKSHCLIKSILRGSTALAELDLWFSTLLVGVGVCMASDSTFFESLALPPTLVKIKVGIQFSEEGSQAFLVNLLRTPLPNLTSLSLSIGNALFANGQLLMIMDKWKGTLKTLEVIGESYHGPPRSVTPIRFPVMKQLEELSVTSITAELESGRWLDSLETCFPKLTTLRIRHQTPVMLWKWAESSRFSKVTSLELTLANENVPGIDKNNFLMSVDIEAMRLVNVAFPNLRKLEVGVSARDPSGLGYVFQEMRGLVELKLDVFGDMSERSIKIWNSMLTGVTVEMMDGPGFRGALDNPVSIRNLQDLRSLCLKDLRCSELPERDVNPGSLTSDFIFDHALLKMPKLTHLHVEAPFNVSYWMTELWKREGRTLTYLAIQPT